MKTMNRGWSDGSVIKSTVDLTECDGLYMLGPGIGTIRKCGPVRVGVALLEWA